MDFYGLNKTTLLDYPGHVAATLFTGGCNFRCPFCHNRDLVLCTNPPSFSEPEILSFLEKRKGILEGVCITGGEPTLQVDLQAFLQKVKALGYLVKLDTNGHNPKILRQLVEEGLIDYVAMDIKASKERYDLACGTKAPLPQIEESVAFLKTGLVDYEFRTTVVKGIHEVEEFDAVGEWLQGARQYFLQSYKDSENVLEKGFLAFSKEELEQMALLAGKHDIPVFLRGID